MIKLKFVKHIKISSFKLVILRSDIQCGCTTVCVHTHTQTQTNLCVCVHTCFFHIQTSNLMINKDQTQHDDDSILVKVTIVLTEIAGVLYKRSKRWSLHQISRLAEVYYFNANLPRM